MKQSTITVLLLSVPLGLAIAEPVFSRSGGIFPSSTRSLTRHASSACGDCHNRSPGGPTVQVQVGARSLTPSQLVPVTVSATGGPSGNEGGFTADVTAGRLIPGGNTRVSSTGDAITHSSERGRAWSFQMQASSQPGPAEFFTVVNAVDGNGKTSGDQWAFHGANPAATISTPVRFFVNAPGINPIGSGCADGYGNVAVIGGRHTPTLGNASFAIEAVGLPPAARVMFIVGVQKAYTSLDLKVMGAPGCFLHSDMLLTAYSQSSSGDAARAEGRFTMPLPIPNLPALKGFFFRTQVGALDASPGARPFPVVFTNGLGITIQ